ncbi:MAG: CotH kinase family protein [Planctomycetes bacterium]|nr:CotH kinase family protein [Planctomycetota bacterium]
MSRRLLALWRWSWIVTVPGLLFFVAWARSTWSQWRALVRDVDPAPVALDLHGLGCERGAAMLRHLRLAATPGNLADVPPAEQLRSVQLFVGDSEIDELDADLPESGRSWVKALLMHGAGLREVKLRYRGDLVTHWGFAKKSMRVRTAETELFSGMREFQLNVPRFPLLGENVLASRLARELGLITPRCEYVNVFRNGHFCGVFECTEQLDEGTLRAHDRMPGDLYAGEALGRDRRRGITDAVFDAPGTWEKLAENNHYPVGSRAPLEALCALLAEPQTEDAHARLLQLVDADAFGRFLAFEALAQSAQCTETHDWRLFWDPWRCRFEPVVQDPAGWRDRLPGRGEYVPPVLHATQSRLHAWLAANGAVLAARHEALATFLGSERRGHFLAEIDATVAKLRHAFAYDPNVRPAAGGTLAASLDSLRANVGQVFGDLARTIGAAPRVEWATPGGGDVALRVDGDVPVDGVVIRFAAPVHPQRAAVGWWTFDRDRRSVDVAMHADGAEVHVSIRLPVQTLPQPLLGAATRRSLPLQYEVHLAGVPGDAVVESVAVVHRGGRTPAPRAAAWPALAPATGLFAALPTARPAAETWRGEVVVAERREVLADVRIEPGTVVRLQPKASLVFRGRVFAEGEADRKIRFEPFAADQDPWGTVCIEGAASSGSRLRHCEFRGGSGLKEPLLECCSMVSLHNCRSVLVADCTFRDNHQYDDVVHVMYAQVEFERVRLEGARADALDCDISEVVIRDSDFVRSVNDGVDLMTTKALIENCRFVDNGDKGVSVGEGSVALVLRSTFDGCGKGLEGKDGSVAHVLHSDLRRCRKVANAYKKNWRYDAGGTLVLQRCVLDGNHAMPTADTWSQVVVQDCATTAGLAAEYDQEYVDGTSTRMQNTARLVECSAGPDVAPKGPPEFPAGLAPLRGLAAAAWQAAIGGKRGVQR